MRCVPALQGQDAESLSLRVKPRRAVLCYSCTDGWIDKKSYQYHMESTLSKDAHVFLIHYEINMTSRYLSAQRGRLGTLSLCALFPNLQLSDVRFLTGRGL